MPDGTTATPEKAPVFTAKEALSFGNAESSAPLLTTEQQAKIDKMKEQARSNGREVFREAAGIGRETRLSQGQIRLFEANFGAGQAEIKEDGSVELSDRANPTEKASYDEAQNAIQQISDVLKYFDIQRAAKQKGVTVENLLARENNELGINARQYSALREKALSHILEKGAGIFNDALTDSSGVRISERLQREFIEKTIANDPILQEKITKKMKVIMDSAVALPEVVKDDEIIQAEVDRKRLNREFFGGIGEVQKKLTEDNFTPTDAQKAELYNLIQAGRSPEIVMQKLRELTVKTLPGYKDLIALDELKQQKSSAEAARRAINQGNNNRNRNQQGQGGAAPVVPQNIQELNNRIADLATKIEAAENYRATHPEDTTLFDLLNKKYSLRNEEGPTDLNKLLSGINAKREEIKAKTDFIDHKSAEGASKKSKESKAIRLIKESELIDDLDSIIGRSLVETLEERYDKMVITQTAVRSKEAEETKSTDTKAVEKVMDQRWIKYDKTSRNKQVNRDTITQDMRVLSYQGEDGLKRLILGDMGFDGIDKQTALSYDLNQLTDEQKKRLEDTYKTMGAKYRDKLMADFYIADKVQGITDIKGMKGKFKDMLPLTNKMNLKKHEWQLLERNFSGALEQAIGNSTAAQEAIRNLERSGIKPDFKMRYLLYLLTGVLGVAAVGGFAAAGGLGVTAKAAATGIGSAAALGSKAAGLIS